MSAKDFFDNAGIQQESTAFALKEKGIELAKQVDVNMLNTVGTELGGLVSDLQGVLGAITGGIGGLLDSVAGDALGALGGLTGGLDDLVGGFMKNLPTSINFPVPQIPGLPDIPQIPSLPDPSNLINVPGITDLSNQIEGAVGNALGNLKVPNISIGGFQFDMPAIIGAVQKQSEEIAKIQEEQVEVDIMDKPAPVGKPDYDIDDNNEVVVETTEQLNNLVAEGQIEQDTVVHVKETASYVVTKLREGEQYVNLHEHNKARKKQGLKPVLPANGMKTGKIDGTPVVRPKPIPPKKTKSTKAAERLAGIKRVK